MKGLLITLLINCFLTILICLINGFTYFLPIFFSILLIQFIIWQGVIQFISFKSKILLKKIKLQELDILSRFNITVECASCHKEFETPILLNQENKFFCPHCNQLNNLEIKFKTYAVLTNIDDLNKTQDQLFNKIIKNESR